MKAELLGITRATTSRVGMPWESVERILVALVATALERALVPEAVQADTFPVPEVAATVRRPPEEVRLAVLETLKAPSTPVSLHVWEALRCDDALASEVNEQVLAAARTCNLHEDILPDFYTEFAVADQAASHYEQFSEFEEPSVSESLDAGLPTTPTDVAKARTARALELRLGGATLAEIGGELGVTRERVRQMLSKVDAPSAEEVRATKDAARDAALRRVRDNYVSFLHERPPMTVSEAAQALGVDRSRFADMLDPMLRRMVLPDPRPSRAHWSRDQVIEVVREAATLEYPLTAKAYDRLLKGGLVKGPSVPRICQVFDGWVAACEAAGIEAGVRPRTDYSSRWTDDDLRDAVVRFMRQTERPTFSSYSAWAAEQDDRPSGQTVRNRMGRWSDIVRIVHEAEYLKRSDDD